MESAKSSSEASARSSGTGCVLRLGVAKRLGIGYEQVRARKPDIVYLSVSAFGYGGLWQYRSGYEPNAPLITGMQARMGGSADRPSGQPFAVND